MYGTNELGAIFSKFGVIESIRILPDRECAFINYSTIEEAIRAKETVMNKMSNRLGNNQVIKVGFGKLDINTPTTPTLSCSSFPSMNDTVVQGPTRALCNKSYK